MDLLAATNLLMELTQTLTNVAQQAGNVSAVIRTAQAEGRTTLTPAEWATIQAADDAGRQVLLASIQKALAVPRAPG